MSTTSSNSEHGSIMRSATEDEEKGRRFAIQVGGGPQQEPVYEAVFGAEDGMDPTFQGKARSDYLIRQLILLPLIIAVLNAAMSEVGMGRYHWTLVGIAGFGWLVDNSGPSMTSLIFTPVMREFKPTHAPLLSLAQNIGLLIGAIVFSLSSDAFGRKFAFNATLGLLAVGTLVAGSAPSFPVLAMFAAFWSAGVGGNLPVDSALLLEFLPASRQHHLTSLSSFWSIGQVITALVGWALIPRFSCANVDNCTSDNNKGWRYFLFTMGAIFMVLFIIRAFVFRMHESPKWLMSRGRDAEAVEVVHKVAKINRSSSSLTVEYLQSVGLVFADSKPEKSAPTTRMGAIARRLSQFDLAHVRRLFATRKLARSTSLILLLWAVIGLAFPLFNAFLPYYLTNRIPSRDHSTHRSYRDVVIVAAVSIPGALVAAQLSRIPGIGRKGVLAVSTLLTGVFVLGTTTAKTQNVLLAWSCLYSVASHIAYGVLYAFTPELFSTRDRGTGNGLAACANRIFGLMSPLVAIYGGLDTSIPIYVSGGLFILAAGIVVALPYETRGRAAL